MPRRIARLADIADAFLMHDRDIYSRYDDSVLRVTPDVGTEYFRRARGFAPFPLSATVRERHGHPRVRSRAEEHLLPAHRRARVRLPAHRRHGERRDARLLRAHDRALRAPLPRACPRSSPTTCTPSTSRQSTPSRSGCPRSASSTITRTSSSVAAEHGVRDRVLGVALDGTGYGTDGTIWGGEWLSADWSGFERVAHLRQLPLPGGAAAIRRPARMALGALAECGLLDHPGAAPLRSRLVGDEETHPPRHDRPRSELPAHLVDGTPVRCRRRACRCP